MQYQNRQVSGSIILLLASIMMCALPAVAKQREGQLVVPENAYANGSAYGNGWECVFGFKEESAQCIAVAVPANGYLNERGNGWKCNRGFREDDGACLKIEVPDSGYLTESTAGTGWACDRKYRVVRDTCELIQVPANAFLTNSAFGSGWECERGYREHKGGCRMVDVPVNAYFVELSYGPGWQCSRGYATSDKRTCVELVVPENAHLDRSGNAWECNRPFSQRGNACITR